MNKRLLAILACAGTLSLAILLAGQTSETLAYINSYSLDFSGLFLRHKSANVLGATTPLVWTASSMQNIGKTSAPGTTSGAVLYSAKNETESFQIAVQAPSGGLSNVNVIANDLTNSSNQTFSKNNFTLYRENYVNISPATPDWGGSNRPPAAGMYPDALIPFTNPDTGADITGAQLDAAPFNVAALNNEVVWVDVLVPANTSAGIYNGSFTVTSNQGSVIVPVTLNVWNFQLPTAPTEKSAFLIWSSSNSAYEQELLKNKLMPDRVSNIANESSFMANFGLNGINIHSWSGADMSTCTMSPAPSVAQFQTQVRLHTAGLYSYNYTADEIDNCPSLAATMQQWAANMHQAGIDNLVTMAPPSSQSSPFFSDGTGSGRSAVDNWVILPFSYQNNPSAIQYAQNKGDKVWSYNALVQDSYSPKWLISYPLINERIQAGFINQSLGLKGLLYWKVDQWSLSNVASYKPWTNPNSVGWLNSQNFAGDGLLVYDGAYVGLPGKFVPSMRLKALRDGVNDFEYVEMLKNLGQGSWALTTIKTIASDFQNWNKDYTQLESVRKQLGDKIQTLSGDPPPTDTTPPSVPANLSATAVSSSQINLSWSASTDNVGITGYKVFRGVSQIGTTVVTNYQNTGLTANTNYTYSVVAYDAALNNSSQSAPANATTQAVADTTPPIISAISVSFITQTGATITWTTNEVSDTQVDYGLTASYGQSTTLSTSPASSHSAILSGLSAGTLYHFKVKSKDTAGNPAVSIDNTFTTVSVLDTTPPSIPANLLVIVASSTSVNLSWTASTDNVGVTGYKVYRNSVQVATTYAASFTDVSLNPSTTYSYTVSAFDAAGNNSVQSTSVSATTSPPPPSSPVISSFTAVPVSVTLGFSASLSWTVTGATSLSIDNGIGSVTGLTSKDVSPSVTTTYTLTATNSAGQVQTQAMVMVTPPPPPAPSYVNNTLVNDNGIVYVIEGQYKIAFSSMTVLKALGYNSRYVINGDTSNYQPSGYVLNSGSMEHPWGSWLKSNIKRDKTIYYLTSTGLIPVPNNSVFANNGGLSKYVLPMSSADLVIFNSFPLLPVMTLGDPRVINNWP